MGQLVQRGSVWRTTCCVWMAVYKVSLLTDTEGRPLGRTLKPGLSSGIKAVELCEGLFAPLPLISAAFSLPKPGHCGGGGGGALPPWPPDQPEWASGHRLCGPGGPRLCSVSSRPALPESVRGGQQGGQRAPGAAPSVLLTPFSTPGGLWLL